MAELDFDKELHRPLQSGSRFANLIPPFSNQTTEFEKGNKESDVFDTLEYMSQWAKKYAWQMEKVAPLLAGRNTQETANNVYSFLYNHFQYKIDNSLQNLYSPAAAWHFRQTGFDCKTFSILASTILQCLKIPHAFRMVKQVGLRSNTNEWIINPDQWTHVYVIAKEKNKYYVIDATTHTNKEVRFIKNHDYDMKHRGLNGAYSPNQPKGLGCACQGKSVTNTATGLSNPAVLSTAISNLHKFLNTLEANGISRKVTDKILELVKYNVMRGVDPNMNEILQKAVLQTSQLGNTAPSFLDSISVNGNSAGNILSAVGGNPTAALGILTSFLPKEFVSKTFGAVFSNNMAMNCWGSTYTPSQTRAYAQTDFPKAYELTLGKGVNEENLHQFYDMMTNVVHQMIEHGTNMNSCSRDAMIGTYGKIAQDFRDKAVENLKQYVKLVPQPNSVIASGTQFPQIFQMNSANKPRSYELGTLRWKMEALPPQITPNGNGTFTVTQADGSSQVMTQQQIETKINGTSSQNTIVGATSVGDGTVRVQFSDGSIKVMTMDEYNKYIVPLPVKNPPKTDLTIPLIVGAGLLAKIMFF